jgi:outer membrane protein assembly factor BamA
LIKKEYIAFIGIILLATACSPTKRLAEGEYLLRKNKLETNGIDLSKEELQAIIKQQPNRKILPFLRFHLHMYNLASDKRLRISREKKNERIERKNIHRAEKGRKLKGEGRTKWEYFKEVVGEPPVILDTTAVRVSSSQLSTYLVKKGYFINEVKDSIVYTKNKKKAKVLYELLWEEPYILDTLEHTIYDPIIAAKMDQEFSYEFVKVGERFDVDLLADERENITNFLRNSGYYLFTHDYIEFEVDSTRGSRKVAVNLILRSPKEALADSLGIKYHQIFQLGDIYFNYDLPSEIETKGDTLMTPEYTFVAPNSYPLKAKVIAQSTFLHPGMLYQHERVEQTYRRLSSLPPLNHVAIRFEPRETLLDAFVSMTPSRRQSFSFETQGTNSTGFLGLEGDVVYRHRNIFRGAELLEIRFQGGVQSQALITDNTATDDFEQSDNVTFNTIEFGPSVSLRFPKFLLPIKMERFAKSSNPTSVLSASYSYQNRPDFERELTSLSFGYEWQESVRKRHQVNLFEASIIRINKSQDFQDRLDELNDRFLSDSYRNHFITASTYTFTYNGQKEPRSKNLFYFRGDAELGGNLLRAGFSAFGQKEDSLGSYEIIGIRFANFFKVHSDSRFYRRFDDKRTVAARFAVGVGVPYGNLDVLPFSKSFFGGGANGLRAWKARTIGPGSFSELIVSYDKIGDVSIEANVEYRFNLIGNLDGAFFVDAGNIWLLREDELRPGGEFQVDRFVSEISVGAGMGFRVDFNFFILRFDVGGQIKDPGLDPGERWLFQPKTSYNEEIDFYNGSLEEGQKALNPYSFRFNLNLGIGYPF